MEERKLVVSPRQYDGFQRAYVRRLNEGLSPEAATVWAASAWFGVRSGSHQIVVDFASKI